MAIKKKQYRRDDILRFTTYNTNTCINYVKYITNYIF